MCIFQGEVLFLLNLKEMSQTIIVIQVRAVKTVAVAHLLLNEFCCDKSFAISKLFLLLIFKWNTELDVTVFSYFWLCAESDEESPLLLLLLVSFLSITIVNCRIAESAATNRGIFTRRPAFSSTHYAVAMFVKLTTRLSSDPLKTTLVKESFFVYVGSAKAINATK